MAKDSLSVTDNRTGKAYELPIENGCIKAIDLRKIKTDDKDFGLMSYDPAFLNTANTKSAITFIDGDAGILEYRGYPIDQLAEKSTHLEVSYLRPAPLTETVALYAEVTKADEAEMSAHVWLEWDGKPRAEVTALWKRWRPR